MAIRMAGDSSGAGRQLAAPRADEPQLPGRCARCQSEHVRELGASSSNLLWMACVDCNYVWMMRRRAPRAD